MEKAYTRDWIDVFLFFIAVPLREEQAITMSSKVPELSIIIPSYNEELRLPNTLQSIAHFVNTLGYSVEVVVVDDGSNDRTAATAEAFRGQIPSLRVVSNGENRGKGYSVRHGMLEARARQVLFTDADLSAPIEEAPKLLEALKTNDIAIGSRALDRALVTVHASPLREFAGIVFNALVRRILHLPFVDTQCGFKAFRRDRCQIIFEQQRIERFGFDPELLYLARRHGLRAAEIPVKWAHSPATKVNMLKDSTRMFADIFSIRFNALMGRYPLSNNHPK